MTISRKEILKCYSQQVASSSQTSMTRTFWTIEQAWEAWGRGRGQTRCQSPPLLFRLFCCLLLFPHINRDVVGVRASCKSSYAKKRRRGTGRRSPKWRLKEANGKWLVSFCLLTRRALISSFLPVCVSRAKRKPFCSMLVPVWVAISLLCIPCNWELISCVSAAQTYEESLVYK